MNKFICKEMDKDVANFSLTYEGFDADITEPYYWHLNFALLINTGYKMFKVEDNHYFSESSEYGGKFRQQKGQSTGYFQQNFTSLIETIKMHLMPALEEVKLAEWYKQWFDHIEDTSKKIKIEREKEKNPEKNTKLKELLAKRDDALLNLKSKWVTEVDGSKLYTISKSGEDRGLDFALLDNLFFGITLPDPLDTENLSKQLEELITPIETTETTLRVLKEFLYRFYTWLPTALKETKMTYALRVNTLRQFYSNIHLKLKFLKPLLKEIIKKDENISKESFYYGLDDLDPFIANLVDSSLSNIKLLLIKDGKFDIKRLEFEKEGFPIKKGDIEAGEMKDKEGFIVGTETKKDKEENEIKKYKFKHITKNKETKEEEEEIILINKTDLKKYNTMLLDFSQKRYGKIVSSPQGKYMAYYNINTIDYKGFAWDAYEHASYVQHLKIEDLDLLEHFVGDISILKEDLMKYIDDVAGENVKEEQSQEKKSENKKENNEKFVDSFLFMPFKGAYELFVKPLTPQGLLDLFPKLNKKSKDLNTKTRIGPIKVKVTQHLWQTYTIFKKSHNYIQY